MTTILLIMLALDLVSPSWDFAKEKKNDIMQNVNEQQIPNAQASRPNLQVVDASKTQEVSQGSKSRYQDSSSQTQKKSRTTPNQPVDSKKAGALQQQPDSGDQTTEAEKKDLRINDLKNRKQKVEGSLLNVQQKEHETQSTTIDNIKP